MSMALDESIKVTPPNDTNIRVKAVTTASQVVSLAEYGPASAPNGQMFLTLQADGADCYVVFTTDATAIASATATALGTPPGGTYPTIKIPNGSALTVHLTASLYPYVAVVGSAAGNLRYWRSSRVGAS
jgi:hypothetical protein